MLKKNISTYKEKHAYFILMSKMFYYGSQTVCLIGLTSSCQMFHMWLINMCIVKHTESEFDMAEHISNPNISLSYENCVKHECWHCIDTAQWMLLMINKQAGLHQTTSNDPSYDSAFAFIAKNCPHIHTKHNRWFLCVDRCPTSPKPGARPWGKTYNQALFEYGYLPVTWRHFAYTCIRTVCLSLVPSVCWSERLWQSI